MPHVRQNLQFTTTQPVPVTVRLFRRHTLTSSLVVSWSYRIPGPIIQAPHLNPWYERLWRRGAVFGGRTVARHPKVAEARLRRSPQPVPKQPVVRASFPSYDWRTEGRVKNYWDMYTLNDNVAGNVILPRSPEKL